jgi:perosamine synthetase
MAIEKSRLAEQITEAIQAAVGKGPLGLHEPSFCGNEWVYVKQCLDSTFVSSVGKFVDRFEQELAEYTGAQRAVAIANGTAALQVALVLAGVAPGDEVLVPALTFVATANSVSHCGAIPHFVDSETRTLGLDAQALREYLRVATELRSGQCINRATGRVIRAVVPMHTFGHPVDLDGVLAVARDFHLELIEDSTEALGSLYHNRHCGTFGRLGTLSFNGNKTITTGGGGAILTNDPDLGRRAKHITTTARIPHRWAFVHDEIAWNYRLPNINAALGCAQMEQLTGFIAAKRRLHERYSAAFAGIAGTQLMREPEGCASNYWLQTIMLDENVAVERDEILSATNDAGLMTRPTWTLMHELPMYTSAPRMDLPVASMLQRRLINIPSSSFLA